MNNIKEQITQLEEIANQKVRDGADAIETAMTVGEIRVAKQALAILKKQEEIINALIEVNHGLAKVKSILEEND